MGTQSLLAGVDNTLDNFFLKSASGSGSRNKGLKAGSRGKAKEKSGTNEDNPSSSLVAKRKRDADANAFASTSTSKSRSGRSPVKKSRLSGAKDFTDSCGSGKGRKVLDDVTVALQNSPHRCSAARGLPRYPGSTSSSSEVNMMKKGKQSMMSSQMKGAADEDAFDSESVSGSELAENDVPLRLRARAKAKTPHRTSKNRLGELAHAPLPTPPSSSMPPGRTLVKRADADVGTRPNIQDTPFTFSSAIEKRKGQTAYPTPVSLAVPRLRLVIAGAEGSASRIPAPNLHLDSDSPLTSLPPSSPERSQAGSQEDKEGGEEHCEIITEVNVLPEKVSPKKDREEEKEKMYTVIPSSQTQYIHYSPTKKRTYDFFGLGAHLQSLPQPQSQHQNRQRSAEESGSKSEVMVIPCSQSTTSSPGSSQVIHLSPRRTRKPAPLVVPSLDNGTIETILNSVVPTSQEDEVEISILEGMSTRAFVLGPSQQADNSDLRDRGKRSERITPQLDNASRPNPEQRNHNPVVPPEANPSPANTEPQEKHVKNTTTPRAAPSQSTQMRFINAMLDDLDRLEEEARLGIVTPSQVLSLSAKVRLDHPKDGYRERKSDREKESWRCQTRTETGDIGSTRLGDDVLVQSSMTEPDASQWDEDPFTLTNEAYARHLGIGVRKGRGPGYSSCTQSSTTQPDSDEEEDPFPTLPPASSAVTTTTATATPIPPTSTAQSNAERNAVDRMLNPCSSQTLPDSQDEPDPEGFEDTSRRDRDMGEVMRSAAKFRRRSEDGEESSQTVPDSQAEDYPENFPWIDAASQSQVESVSTLDVMRLLDSDEVSFETRIRGTKFRRKVAVEEREEDEDEETMPGALRDFLAIFSQDES